MASWLVLKQQCGYLSINSISEIGQICPPCIIIPLKHLGRIKLKGYLASWLPFIYKFEKRQVFTDWVKRMLMSAECSKMAGSVTSSSWIPWIPWIVLELKVVLEKSLKNEFLKICSWNVLQFYFSSFIRNSAHLFHDSSFWNWCLYIGSSYYFMMLRLL